ncbi:MAG: protein kinase [Proteobacteria bacterium]|nr:protein kinase [Pseudomonadota bacterium]
MMEYLHGATLRELIDGRRALPLERLAAIVEQVGQALAAAHDKGFVHCDVKPENIVVDDSGARPAVKLLDFGIATLLSADASDLGAPTAVGTAPMALEQLAQGPVDARTDVYALGVLTYELLTGRHPFPGADAAGVRRLQTKRAPAPPSRERTDLSSAVATGVDAVVLHALALAPEQRYAGARPFLAALQHALGSAAASAAGGGVGAPRALARKGWLAVGAAALLLALVAGLLGPASRRPRPDRSAPPTARAASAKPTSQRRPPGLAAPAPQTLVLAALSRGDAATRAQVLVWIGQLNRISLAKAVLAGTSDVEARVRRSAALALATLRPTPAGSHEALHRMLAAAQGQAEQAWLRLDAATALARLGDPLGVQQLERELLYANPWLRVAILEALAHLRHRGGLALAQHLRDATPVTRAARLGALARLERTTLGRRARLELLRALQAGAWEERLLAAQALASIAPGRARAALRQAPRRTQRRPAARRAPARPRLRRPQRQPLAAGGATAARTRGRRHRGRPRAGEARRPAGPPGTATRPGPPAAPAAPGRCRRPPRSLSMCACGWHYCVGFRTEPGEGLGITGAKRGGRLLVASDRRATKPVISRTSPGDGRDPTQ